MYVCINVYIFQCVRMYIYIYTHTHTRARAHRGNGRGISSDIESLMDV